MDLRQTFAYTQFLEKISWIVVKDTESEAFIFIRTIPLTRLSVIKVQRPERLPTKDLLDRLIVKYRAIQLNIEPVYDSDIKTLVAWKMRRQTISFLPSATMLLDLRLPFTTLVSAMKQKTRYNFAQSQKKGVRVEVIGGEELARNKQKFDSLFWIQKQNAKRLGIFSLPRTWFENQVTALSHRCFATMAYVGNDLVAATFYMVSDDTVYYSHNGSTPLGRKTFAPTACVVAGIREGQKRRLSWFDFEGIFDPRSRVIRWQGFTRFKKGFGGREVLTPGLYSKWVWPF